MLEYCNIDNLDEKEIYYINVFNTTCRDFGYNLKSGGQFGGSIYSNESKLKLSNSIKESYLNSNLREKRKFDALNQWSNPKIKQKILGENNSMYGRHHTEESKKKMSQNKKGIRSWRRNNTPVFCIELNKVFNDATEAGKELSIDGSAILKVCQNKRKTCGGYHWKFYYNLGK